MVKYIPESDLLNFKIAYNPNRQDVVIKKLIRHGGYSMREKNLIRRLINPDDIVLDCGAHVGYFTMAFSKLVPMGYVYAFEPDKENFRLLTETIEVANKTKNIAAFNLAISDQPEDVKLYLNPNNTADNRIGKHEDVCRNFSKVKAVTLDDFCIGNNIKKVDFIKMDIQGYEPKAFRGMKTILKNNPQLKMMLEFWDYGFDMMGEDSGKFFGELIENFNSIYLANGIHIECFEDLPDLAHHFNLFCENRRA